MTILPPPDIIRPTLIIINPKRPVLQIVDIKPVSHASPDTIRPRINKYTYDIFIERAREVHGDKFNYSQVKPEHIKNQKSKIPLQCNNCKYEWLPTIYGHIYKKNGCPECSGNAPWNLKKFLKRCKEIHGDKFNYSKIKPEHIEEAKSKISIQCNFCEYEWSTTINSHINGKSGCPECFGNLPWNLEKFIKRAKEVHGDDKFNYNQVELEHIKNQKSNVPLQCVKCQYEWSITINNHINKKSGCPDCAGTLPWNIEKLLKIGKEIHGDTINYDRVKPEHIENNKSKIPLKCNKCKYEWDHTTIHSHINQKAGCPDCSGKNPWTLEKLLIKGKEVHGDTINYSRVKPEHIRGKYSNIPLQCNKCQHEWTTTIGSHINGKTGCPVCSRKNQYSKISIEWLESIEKLENIIIRKATSVEGEFRIPSLNPGYYYSFDGYCATTNTVYEFHGDYWHGNPIKYDPGDINKTLNKTYGELYRKTLERENYIRSLGYNLIVKWETPF